MSTVRTILDTRPQGEACPSPAVSLIVPVFNVESVVADCLRSIQANAQAVDLEMIIIDDGSTDGSARGIEALLNKANWPPVLFLQQANRGLSAARNTGAQFAQGEYIGFLDSDDGIEPGALRLMLDLGRASGAEVVLGRTEIFDGVTGSVTPFYDAALWRRLLNGMAWRVIDAGRFPAVLSFEPNANYRLIRRDFYVAQGLHFPEGLLFEDAPVHFRMLLQARRIALLNQVYYHYRINRPGKITEAVGQQRFDVLQVARLALAELMASGSTPEQGGAALHVLFRLAWGCGIMTLPEQRLLFFSEACAVFRPDVPHAWRQSYRRQNRWDLRHWLLGELLMGGAAGLLADVAFGRLPLAGLARFLCRFSTTCMVADPNLADTGYAGDDPRYPSSGKPQTPRRPV